MRQNFSDKLKKQKKKENNNSGVASCAQESITYSNFANYQILIKQIFHFAVT